MRNAKHEMTFLRFHFFLNADVVIVCAALRYPADAKTFTRSGMKGAWERERAGQRMKLPQPETWERLLSLEGNSSTTWEKLIGSHPPYYLFIRRRKKIG